MPCPDVAPPGCPAVLPCPVADCPDMDDSRPAPDIDPLWPAIPPPAWPAPLPAIPPPALPPAAPPALPPAAPPAAPPALPWAYPMPATPNIMPASRIDRDVFIKNEVFFMMCLVVFQRNCCREI